MLNTLSESNDLQIAEPETKLGFFDSQFSFSSLF